ncbi:hypothetical protein Tco_0360480 [Tanacetum coccineum]
MNTIKQRFLTSFDPLLLVEHFNPVEDNTGVLESDVFDDSTCLSCFEAELLIYVRDTCPNAINLSVKKVAVTPKNKVKKVRFTEPLTSSSNIKQVESSKTSDSNTPVLSSTGLKCSTSKSGSKPTGNKKNDRISRTPSRNIKNKVEAQLRKVNKKNRVVEPICDVDANSICATCKKSMFDGVHDMCLLDFVKNVNSHAKSAKKHKKQNIWKPTSHVFTEVGLKWKPTGRTFTIVAVTPLRSNKSADDTTKLHRALQIEPDLSFFHIFGVHSVIHTIDNDDLVQDAACTEELWFLATIILCYSIDQDVLINTPSTHEHDTLPTISQGFE